MNLGEPCERLLSIYKEKAIELKLAKDALNRPKNHTGEKETHKRNKVGHFLLKSCSYFLAPIMDRFFPYKSLKFRCYVTLP